MGWLYISALCFPSTVNLPHPTVLFHLPLPYLYLFSIHDSKAMEENKFLDISIENIRRYQSVELKKPLVHFLYL